MDGTALFLLAAVVALFVSGVVRSRGDHDLSNRGIDIALMLLIAGFALEGQVWLVVGAILVAVGAVIGGRLLGWRRQLTHRNK